MWSKEDLKNSNNEVTEKKKPFKCDLCISRFLSRNHLEIHVKSKHNSKDENLSKSDKDQVKKTKNVKEDQKMYFCKVCEKEVIQFGHVKTFHIDGNVKCPKCDKAFAKKTEVNRHIVAKHEQKKKVHLKFYF